jgi:hypothetical protein
VHPELLLLFLGAANVCVWAQQDVLELGLLLVDLFDGLATLGPLVAGSQGLDALGLGTGSLCSLGEG